ncbi:MAG TPA: tyrosine-type recombinase/integrase [Anaerolineales bacterium]|nr:tyrosine-type recombinase/integrase [Anaerolineales bacterium]
MQPVKLNDLVEMFVSDVCAGKTNTTPKTYRGKLSHLIKYFGADADPSAFTEIEVKKFKHHLETRKTKYRGKIIVNGSLSPFTVRSSLVSIRHFFKWAASSRYIPNNPMEKIKIQKPPAPDPKAVSNETFEKLVKTAIVEGEIWAQPRNVAILYVLRDTGGRVGGLVGADIDNLDLTRGRMEVIEKGGKRNTLFLSPPTIQILKSWLEIRKTLDPKDYLIFTGKKGTGLTASGIYGMLRRLATSANVTGRHNPHAFRHAFARDTLKAGADLSHVSQLMHHTSIVVTADYYARWADNELRDMHSRFSPGRTMSPINFSEWETPEYCP